MQQKKRQPQKEMSSLSCCYFLHAFSSSPLFSSLSLLTMLINQVNINFSTVRVEICEIVSCCLVCLDNAWQQLSRFWNLEHWELNRMTWFKGSLLRMNTGCNLMALSSISILTDWFLKNLPQREEWICANSKKKNPGKGFVCSNVGVLGTRISTLKLSIPDLACIGPYSQCLSGHKFEANRATHADPWSFLSIWHNRAFCCCKSI